MILITDEIKAKLIANGTGKERGKDHFPVVKLFTPMRGCTWLLTEMDPEEPDIAFGLCDLGMGFPELGNVSIEEITTAGVLIERDLHFTATGPISRYANAARSAGQIVSFLP